MLHTQQTNLQTSETTLYPSCPPNSTLQTHCCRSVTGFYWEGWWKRTLTVLKPVWLHLLSDGKGSYSEWRTSDGSSRTLWRSLLIPTRCCHGRLCEWSQFRVRLHTWIPTPDFPIEHTLLDISSLTYYYLNLKIAFWSNYRALVVSMLFF